MLYFIIIYLQLSQIKATDYPTEFEDFKENCYIAELPLNKEDLYNISNNYTCLNLLFYPYYIELDKLNENIEKLAIHYEKMNENLNQIIKLKRLKELVLSGNGVQNVDFVKDLKELKYVYLLNTKVDDLQYFKENNNVKVFVMGEQYYNFKFKELYKDYKNIEILNPYIKIPSASTNNDVTKEKVECNNIYKSNKQNSLLNNRIINFIGGYHFVSDGREKEFYYENLYFQHLGIRDIVEIVKYEYVNFNDVYDKANNLTAFDIILDKIDKAILDDDDFMLKIEDEEVILFFRKSGALTFDELNKYKIHSTITGMYNLFFLYSGLKRGANILTVLPSGNFNKGECFGVKAEQNMMICY